MDRLMLDGPVFRPFSRGVLRDSPLPRVMGNMASPPHPSCACLQRAADLSLAVAALSAFITARARSELRRSAATRIERRCLRIRKTARHCFERLRDRRRLGRIDAILTPPPAVRAILT